MTKQEATILYIAENYLDHGRLRYDIVSDKLQVREENAWREMTKLDVNSIVCHSAQQYNANITSREVLTALHSDLIPRVHPLREYLRALPPHSPQAPDWIDMVAQQVTIKPPYNSSQGGEASEDKQSSLSGEDLGGANALWRLCFKKWFVAMVASWLYDDVVNHQVLVLIGRQGIYKTTWLERLIPPELRAYSCKMTNSFELNKDERLRIAEFGLISLDEIDSMNNRELNQFKSLITASDVNERAAYAYSKERRMRLASFCASGNRHDFLTDITGNRRWLPFEVESIQNPFFTTLPYMQMYAQALYLIEHDFNYWFDLDEIEVIEEHNQLFRDESMEEQWIPILFDVPAEGRGIFLTTGQISERLVTYGNIKRPLPLNLLGRAMRDAGFQDVRRKIGNLQKRGWIVYQRDTNEIEHMKHLLLHE